MFSKCCIIVCYYLKNVVSSYMPSYVSLVMFPLICVLSLEYPGVWSRNILAARNCGIAISPLFSGWSSVTYAKGDKKGSIEAPFLSTNRIQTAFTTAAAKILPPSSAKNTTGQQPGNVSLEPEGSI